MAQAVGKEKSLPWIIGGRNPGGHSGDDTVIRDHSTQPLNYELSYIHIYIYMISRNCYKLFHKFFYSVLFC